MKTTSSLNVEIPATVKVWASTNSVVIPDPPPPVVSNTKFFPAGCDVSTLRNFPL